MYRGAGYVTDWVGRPSTDLLPPSALTDPDNQTPLTGSTRRFRIPVVHLWEEMKPRREPKSRQEHFTC